jgi:hypothetical protein
MARYMILILSTFNKDIHLNWRGVSNASLFLSNKLRHNFPIDKKSYFCAFLSVSLIWAFKKEMSLIDLQ